MYTYIYIYIYIHICANVYVHIWKYMYVYVPIMHYGRIIFLLKSLILYGSPSVGGRYRFLIEIINYVK